MKPLLDGADEREAILRYMKRWRNELLNHVVDRIREGRHLVETSPAQPPGTVVSMYVNYRCNDGHVTIGVVSQDDQCPLCAALRENQQLRQALQDAMQWLGPTAPTCEGCSAEIDEALKAFRLAGIEYQPRKASGGEPDV